MSMLRTANAAAVVALEGSEILKGQVEADYRLGKSRLASMREVSEVKGVYERGAQRARLAAWLVAKTDPNCPAHAQAARLAQTIADTVLAALDRKGLEIK